MGRTEKSKKNMLISLLGQTIILLISFVTRSVFVKTLSSEYLGLNGLFSNIISLLSLSELGVGIAITYSLYKPIADNNINEINAIMYLYKQVYKYIGLFILSAGLLIIPFLSFFIKGAGEIPYLKFYFILYILNSVVTYFYTYKQSLVVAYQNNYIVSLNRYLFTFIRNVFQIIILLKYNSFMMYLVTQIIFTLIENTMISKIADRMYPFIKNNQTASISKETSREIKKNTLAMLFHKIGTVIVNGTDNVIISKFVGLASVGMYSNYWLVVTSLNAVYDYAFSSLTATVGNLGLTQSKEYSLNVFKKIYFVNYWIYSFSAVSLTILFNPFISLWLGDSYVLSQFTVYLIVINFYITGMRTGVNTFKNSYGLFWNDRYKPLIESLVNLIASLILVQFYGVNGVLVGTIISTLTTSFWIEPLVLFKHGFDEKLVTFMKIYIKYISLTIFIVLLTKLVTDLFIVASFKVFLLKAIICVVIPNVIIISLFFKSSEFKTIRDALLRK